MFTQKESKEPKPEEHKEDEEGEDEDEDVEKEVVGNWKLVDLSEIAVVTGEENEQETAKFKTKIYRFRNKEWKERGVGELRFLKHKVNSLIRVINRSEKTKLVTVNHLPVKHHSLGILEQLKTSNNSWTWVAQDNSDGTPVIEKFAAKFTSKEEYERFEKLFNEACENNGKIFAERKKEAEKEGEEKVEAKVEPEVQQKTA